jgi:hypothetical protein
MAKRERLEDLGVLFQMLTELVDHKLFKLLGESGCRRSKDFVDHFDTLSEDVQYDLLNSLAYELDDALGRIADCWVVARGDEE